MQSSWLTVITRLFWEIISDLNLDPVTPVGLDERTWELAVDEDAILLHSIGSNDTIVDAELVLASDTSVWHCAANTCGTVKVALVAE
jgi:hypothetical protein